MSLPTYGISQKDITAFLARLGYLLTGVAEAPKEIAPGVFEYSSGLTIKDVTYPGAAVKNYSVDGTALSFYNMLVSGGWTPDPSAPTPAGLPALRGLPGTGDTIMFTPSYTSPSGVAGRLRTTGMFSGPEEGFFKFTQ